MTTKKKVEEKKPRPEHAGKRGPVAWRPTAVQINNIKLWRAGGITVDNIAKLLGVPYRTLYDNCSEMLKGASAAKFSENLARLEKAAKAGNVAAIKYLDAKFSSTAADDALRALGDAPEAEAKPADAVKPVRVGKKEAALEDAGQVIGGQSSVWGNDLNPKIIQ